MEKFIDIPHLPNGYVSRLILGEKYKKVLEKPLLERNIATIWLKNNDFVDKRLSGHCDLMAVHMGKNELAVIERSESDCLNINNIELNLIANMQKPQYPYDAELNFCIVGRHVIFNPKTANSELIDKLDLIKLECKQGYTKCSVCVADENSIITSDSAIANIALRAGLDVLKISNNIVALNGFEYGFIGGASFKISKTQLAFTGVIEDQAERCRIERFLSEHDIVPVYLTDRRIFDIGSAIPITEII